MGSKIEMMHRKIVKFKARRGVRVVYGAALEKRSTCKRSVGSNPTLSALTPAGCRLTRIYITLK